MTFPQSIVIGPIEYRIEAIPNLHSSRDGDEILGEMDPTACFIRVEREIPMQRKWVTFWHEILHAILAQAQRGDVPDKVIGVLAFGIVEVLRRNPGLTVIENDD